ncbi:DEAD/DEAH box helicase [Candidatus Poribacteria bacterium]|nr:DEAD/DEAH box helicase [Candidatus Poribacteria bacterium]
MELKEIFNPQGLIAKKLEGYEERPQQLEIAKAVSKALQDSVHLIVEAGTGVGKSFAYLIPIINFAVNRSERVVVSTNTISLQEQLINKDIPFLQEILPHDFKVVLVKGRSNYLCLRRLEGVMTYDENLFDTKEEDEMVRIHQWAEKTKDGSLSDLEPHPNLNVWNQVCAERDNCLGPVKCHYAKQCFYQKARSTIYKANLLVVNHHLLFSDLALRRENTGFSVLPGYKYVLLDEAQNIENVATDHIGISLSNFTVSYLLDSLCRRDRKRGLLVRLKAGDCFDLVDKARSNSASFFELVEQWFGYENSGTKRLRQKGVVDNLLDKPLLDLQMTLRDLREVSQTEEEEKEIYAHIERCQRVRDEINIFLNQSLDDSVYWVEISRGRFNTVRLNSAPVNVSEDLRPGLFNSMESVIMTSATLSTDKNFEYFKQRIGLSKCRELMLGSPFDYKRQVCIYIPLDMPDPRSFDAFTTAAEEKIKHYIQMTQGKAFVLFTSYHMMNRIYKQLKTWMQEQNINSFKQADGLSRHVMLERFKKDVDSVIFGTSSFWEGVDVRGESLSNVIVVKLPFSVPTHPVVEARIENIQARGGNSFMEYNLPEAIIKLKQGFGRLIRTKDDKGIVAILDPRIKTKFYGKLFLKSLPECKIITE